MSFLGDFHFIRPLWLLLLPMISWLWWRGWRSRDALRGWKGAMAPELLAAMTVGDDRQSRWLEYTRLAAWLIALVAVAGPTWRPEPSPFADDPVPLMLVLKANQTMDLTDLSPTRLERAQLKIADIAEERKGEPLGLVAYAGSAHLVLPPTRDTSVVATMAAEISSSIMPLDGDALAAALQLAAATLGESGGSLLVVADAIAPGSLPSLQSFRQKSQIPIYFLAVARPDTPELDAIEAAASALDASVELLTPDNSDILRLVRKTASAPVAVAVAGSGTRWAEAGWWLVPVLALYGLTTFRAVKLTEAVEASP